MRFETEVVAIESEWVGDRAVVGPERAAVVGSLAQDNDVDRKEEPLD